MIAIGGKATDNFAVTCIGGKTVSLIAICGRVVYQYEVFDAEIVDFYDITKVYVYDGRLDLTRGLMEAMKPAVYTRVVDFTDLSKIHVNDGMVDLKARQMEAMKSAVMTESIAFRNKGRFLVNDGVWNQAKGMVEVSVYE